MIADAALYLPFAPDLVPGVNAALVVLVVTGVIAEMAGALRPMIGTRAAMTGRSARATAPLPSGCSRCCLGSASAGPMERALSRGAACACRRSPCSTGRAASLPRPRGASMRLIFGLPANVVYFTAGIYALLILATIIVGVLRWRRRRALCRAHLREPLVVVDDRRVHARHPAQPDGGGRLPRLHLLSRAEGISLARADPAHRPRGAAVRLSRHPHPVLLGGDRLVRHVHRLHPGVDVSVLSGADGAQRRDARLPARGRHAVLGPDDDRLHARATWRGCWSRRRHQSGRGGVGLLFFLVVLTQFNDVAQFTWGKLSAATR